MKKLVNILLLVSLATCNIHAQTASATVKWQKSIGGSGTDVLTAMCVDKNNAIVLCGYSNSVKSGNKSNGSFGKYDYWIVKLNALGNILWNKTYGGKDDDFAAAITPTSDGGYLVGGSSVSNASGSKSSNSYGNSFDYWLLKLDVNGNKIWDVTIGGLSTDKLTAVTELTNGKYAAGGYAYSNNDGNKKPDNLGTENNADYWVVLIDPANPTSASASQFVYGAIGHDVMTCLVPSATGFYAAGYSYSDKSPNGKNQVSVGNNDYWILRSNTLGNYEYQGAFGGNFSDYLTCMQVLQDSSFVAGGYSNSDATSSKSGAFLGQTDYWFLKVKRSGAKQWDKTIGGTGADYMTSLQRTTDKGFILGGYSNSNASNTKTENSKGGFDYWIVKTDSLGKVQWDKTLGGTRNDTLVAVKEIGANEYILAGTSASVQSGDKTSGLVGNKATDYWVVRLNAKSSTAKSTNNGSNTLTPVAANAAYKLEIAPNPATDILTVRYQAVAGSKASFVIYNTDGKPLLQTAFNVNAGQNTYRVKISSLPAGNYFAVMYAGEIKLTSAFTKQ